MTFYIYYIYTKILDFMPYIIHRFPNGKYKVKTDKPDGKYHSKKYLTYEEAVKQLKALYANTPKEELNN